MEVQFFAPHEVEDRLLKFAVILARSGDQWVLCRHKDRTTWENPGGHREPEETIEAAARRELCEETGALTFTLTPVCAYCYGDYGMLYTARITAFEKELHSEIKEIRLTKDLPSAPEEWTYPLIQPFLVAEARRRGALG